MKDNDTFNQGWLQSQYYAAYAQYFVKYIQAYQAQGVPIDYVSAQNEPTCCGGYPSMSWNGSGLDYFTKTNLLPAFHAAGLTTKVLALDWNWDTYASYGAPQVDDTAIRNDPNFGGIAWHGYGGNVSQQTTMHNQYPNVDAYDTEHSGGTWIGNQQQEDMNNIIDYTRNWGKSVVKWSLAVDQNMGPHNGGCGTCTGLITVHNGDSRSGQVDYTIEYYDMGQLTKFVKPGAYRIDSTANSTVPNVAWQQPGRLQGADRVQRHRLGPVREGQLGRRVVHLLPAGQDLRDVHLERHAGRRRRRRRHRPDHRPRRQVRRRRRGQLGQRHRRPALRLQRHRRAAVDRRHRRHDPGARQVHGRTSAGTANGAKVQLYDCNGTAAQQWSKGASSSLVNPVSGKCLDATGPSSANGTRLQIWTCTGAANQQWTTPYFPFPHRQEDPSCHDLGSPCSGGGWRASRHSPPCRSPPPERSSAPGPRRTPPSTPGPVSPPTSPPRTWRRGARRPRWPVPSRPPG